MFPDARQREVVRRLWIEGPLSRSELHRRTGMTPNGVGVVVESLLKDGLVRECVPDPSSGGRPPVPVELDPTTRYLVGLAISPGHVEIGKLGLRGQLIGTPTGKAVSDPRKIIPVAREMLKGALSKQAIAIGISMTGFVDPDAREILFSSATPGLGAVNISGIYEQAGDVPVILENDMHATAARWMLTHRTDERGDVLMVGFDDGAIGAAMLINGRPNRGCVTAANELGHTRFLIETEKCYCGHMGCIERICSSDYLHRQGAPAESTLLQQVTNYVEDDPGIENLVKYLSCTLANACNFVRPNRLVLVSRLVRFPKFNDLLMRSIRGQLLDVLAERIRIDIWDQPAVNSAETAGWLGLASLFDGWTSTAQ